jgi:predicted Rossmann fold flavoprotein
VLSEDAAQTAGPDEAVEIVVVGGGAAGLAASIAAAETLRAQGRQAHVVLLDGAQTLGAKILVSGGGRCNVTHDVVTPKDFFGNPHIVKNVLAAFPVQVAIEWFASLGVPLKRESTGKLFPVTDKARTVLEALLARCRAVGVRLRTHHRVTGIERLSGPAGGFAVRHTQGVMTADTVIMASGGRSLPKTGSDGFGYQLVRLLGHDVTSTVPALVPLLLAPSSFHRVLSGVSQEVELTTVVEGRTVDRRVGSLLWTHVGVSGPAVMDASRLWTVATDRGESVDIYANFLPGRTGEQARTWFNEEAAAHPRWTLLRTLTPMLPERMAEALCRGAVGNPQQAIAQMPRPDRQRLVDALTRFRLPIAGDRGWNYAEVTAGGVPLEQVDYRTMESKLVPGLYLIGEILDCDGRIGGFNFQWAWATGFLGGRAAARRSLLSMSPSEVRRRCDGPEEGIGGPGTLPP